MKLKTSLRKINILRFYFSVSFTPNWTLVKNFTRVILIYGSPPKIVLSATASYSSSSNNMLTRSYWRCGTSRHLATVVTQSHVCLVAYSDPLLSIGVIPLGRIPLGRSYWRCGTSRHLATVVTQSHVCLVAYSDPLLSIGVIPLGRIPLGRVL